MAAMKDTFTTQIGRDAKHFVQSARMEIALIPEFAFVYPAMKIGIPAQEFANQFAKLLAKMDPV